MGIEEGTKFKGNITGLVVILISLVLFLCLAFFLKLLYSLPLKDSLLWYVGLFYCFYIPGSLLLRYLSINKDEFFINLFHSIALGAALVPLVYLFLRRMSHPELIYPFGFAMLLIWLFLTVGDFKRGRISIHTSYPDIQAVVLLIAAVFLLLHLSHFTDVVFLESGFKIRNTYLSETIFHLGIINALKDMFPPLYPYASGVGPSHYHLSMHLEIEMFNRFFSIDTLKLTFFYFPLLYFYLLVFIPYIFIRKNWNMWFLAVITGILMFGSGFSFVPGLLSIFPQYYPWTTFFTPTIWAVFTLNGNLPALFVMFLCILYLKKYYEDDNLSYLFMFALLGFSAYSFKSSMGPHIMAAVFITGIASLVIVRDMKRCLLLCGVSGLTVLAMVVDLTLIRGGIPSHYIITIDLLNTFHRSLEKLGISTLPWIFLILIFPLYILVSFGVRALGLYVMKDAFKKTFFDPVIIFLLVFTVSGFILPDIIFIGFPQSKIGTLNNAGWFGAQALTGSWLLLAFSLARYRHTGKRFFAMLIVVVLLSAPSTVQFLTLRYNKSYYTVDHDALEVVKFLNNTDPESVILHPPNLDGPSLASNLAGRQTVISFFQSYVLQMIGQEEADKRYEDVKIFFDPNVTIGRETILKKYSVDYIYVQQSHVSFLDKDPLLFPILRNSTYTVYKVKKE
jgi:hypothetical protein